MQAECYLDEAGAPPPMGGLWRNPTMGRTFERLLAEAEAAGAGSGAVAGSEARRQAEIAGIRSVWSTGFVAEAIASHSAMEWRNDRTDSMERGLISMGDAHPLEAGGGRE